MTDVYCLQQTEADLPLNDCWLSAKEAFDMNALRFKKRRDDWRLGRWTAKRALAIYLDVSSGLAGIEIRPAASGAPQVYFENQPAAASLSLSHSAGTAICGVAPAGVALGCDLEWIAPRSSEFVADYFTSEEQALIERAAATHRPWFSTLLWSAKESALKALGVGLRADTRSVIVSPIEPVPVLNTWQPLYVSHAGGRVFHGWWQSTGSYVRTFVAAPAPTPPTNLGKIT